MALISKNVLAGDVLFVGVGLGGCRLVNAIQLLGYECYYINTAIGDFENLEDIDEDMTYPIPKSKGCNKDMSLAYKMVADYISDIHNKVESGYKKYKHIIFCFTLGGGTGAGSAPAIAQYFANQYQGSKTVGIVGILPSKEDNAISSQNALDCLEYIETQCDGITSKILLDNSKEDKFTINTDFAKQIDVLLSLPENQADKLKTLKSADERETLSLLGIEGYVHIARISSPTKKTQDGEPYVIDGIKYIPATKEKGCVEIAVSLSEKSIQDFNPDRLFDRYGRPLSDVKAGINSSDTSYAYVFGTGFPTSVLETLNKWLDEFEEEREKLEVTEVDFSVSKKRDFLNRGSKEKLKDPFAKKTGITKTGSKNTGFGAKFELPKENPFKKK